MNNDNDQLIDLTVRQLTPGRHYLLVIKSDGVDAEVLRTIRQKLSDLGHEGLVLGVGPEVDVELHEVEPEARVGVQAKYPEQEDDNPLLPASYADRMREITRNPCREIPIPSGLADAYRNFYDKVWDAPNVWNPPNDQSRIFLDRQNELITAHKKASVDGHTAAGFAAQQFRNTISGIPPADYQRPTFTNIPQKDVHKEQQVQAALRQLDPDLDSSGLPKWLRKR